MNIGINGINIKGDKKKTLNSLVEILERKKFKIFYSDTLNKSFSKTTYPNINKKNISIIDYVISFGGDGTLLNTVSLIGKSETKILGVNVGKLGFLSYDVSEVFEQIIEEIIRSNYTLEKRSLVSISNKKDIIKNNFALNEISVIKKDSSSILSKLITTFLTLSNWKSNFLLVIEITLGYNFDKFFTKKDPTSPVEPATQGISDLSIILNQKNI